MNKKPQKKEKSKIPPIIQGSIYILIAIILGSLIFYGVQHSRNKKKQNGNHDLVEFNTVQPVENTIEPTVSVFPSPEVTVSPSTTPSASPEKSPLPEESTEPNRRDPVKVKGIYITGPRAGSGKEMEKLIELVDSTELNAMVIDIKNDSGEITYKMKNSTVKEIGAGTAYIHDIKSLIKKLKKKNIYLIARIVAFKDPTLAKNKPELSLKNKDGSIFHDEKGLSWVNPYKKEVWDYLIEVAGAAAKLGFDEIQFDYIRFSTDKGMKHVNFGAEAKDKSKKKVISEFTEYAYEKLSKKGVYVSADVYGTIIGSKVDAKIVGQNYADMATNLDYICPMVYPSHYADGSYKIADPNSHPYEIIFNALTESNNVLNKVKNKEVAIVRPWLQDFYGYGKKEIRAQIKAVKDAGYEEWILWNASNRYTEEGLLKE